MTKLCLVMEKKRRVTPANVRIRDSWLHNHIEMPILTTTMNEIIWLKGSSPQVKQKI